MRPPKKGMNAIASLIPFTMNEEAFGTSLQPQHQSTVVTLLWLWWKERNRWREEGRRRAGREVAYMVAARADKLKQLERSELLSDSGQKKRWISLKINSDGSYFPTSGIGGWGYVIRDNQGAFCKAGAGSEAFLQNAFDAELLGRVEGMKMAAQMGMAQVILETDASMVKTALEGDEYRLSSMGGIVTEIKHLMAMEFSSCVISICSRNCNKLAHGL